MSLFILCSCGCLCARPCAPGLLLPSCLADFDVMLNPPPNTLRLRRARGVQGTEKVWEKPIDEEGGQGAIIAAHVTQGKSFEAMVEYRKLGERIYVL